MGRLYYITCDGCGKREGTAKADCVPETFTHTLVAINPGPTKEFDLCKSCYSKLIGQADPEVWNRVSPASV